MNRDGIITQAKSLTPKNSNGSWDEEALLNNIVELIAFDPQKERRAKAKALLDKETKPNGTERDGWLQLPLFNDNFNYEPHRLIRDDDKSIIENADAPTDFKNADVRRSLLDLNRKQRWHNRKFAEQNVFNKWALDEALKGRPQNDLTWGNCIKELGLWRAGKINDDIGGDDSGTQSV